MFGVWFGAVFCARCYGLWFYGGVFVCVRLWRFLVVCGATGWCVAWRCVMYSYGVWSGDVSCGMVLLGMWCVMWRKVKGDMVVLFGMVLCFVIGV